MVVRQMQGEQLSMNTTRRTKPPTPPTITTTQPQAPLTLNPPDLRGEEEGEVEVLEDE